MAVKYLDIEYLRAQNSNVGQLILTGSNNLITSTSFVTVDLNGNVGIGTSAPTSTLSVSGNVQLYGAGSTFIFPDGSTQSIAATNTPSIGPAGTVQFSADGGAFGGDATHLFWDINNQRLGIGTSVPVSSLQIKHTAIESTSTAVTTTNPTVLDGFSILNVRSAHYFVQVTDETYSQFHTTQVMVVHDGIKVYNSEYNIVTSADKLGEFDCQISGGQLQLIFTAYAATSKSVKITRTSMTA